METAYLKSSENLMDYYGIQTIDVSPFAYPYNILLSQWDVSRKLRLKSRYRELQLHETEEQNVELSIKETINTGSTLYYIPLAPLYKALQDEENECAKLLLGVCVYLHRKAGVCHYRDSESYVCYLYDIMDYWIEDDKDSMDEGDYEEQRATLDEMFHIGDKMTSILADENHLLRLRSIIDGYTPFSRYEHLCIKLANQTLAVWNEYPQANLYQHIVPIDEDDEDNYYGNGKIQVTDYISFIGETSSNVYDTMMNMTNDDFNERSGVQDFEATVSFNEPCGKYKDGLDYEEQVIAIIDELCNLITEMP
ncbi:MAG: hypothetical protein WC615_17395 [Mucilaginibacter sp.]|uniref:hypothetical protein n=1 Tax=Mucilaginibacter sp. TaxID=1882438 RepID=UPI003565F7EF